MSYLLETPVPPRTARTVSTVAAVGAVLAGLSYLFWHATETCEGWDCLGAALLAGAVTIAVVPVLAAVALWLLRVPRPALVALTATAVGLGLGSLVTTLQTVRHDFAAEVPLAPAPVYLLAGALAGVVGLFLVGRGTWSGWVRLTVLGVLVAVGITGYVGYETARTRHLEQEIAAVPVTLYLPELGESARATHASAWGGAVHISYTPSPASGTRYHPWVTIVPVSGKGLCEDAYAAGFYGSSDRATCRIDGDELIADAGYGSGSGHFVGVRIGETLLVAEVDGDADHASLVDALRAAPSTTAGELARLRYPG